MLLLCGVLLLACGCSIPCRVSLYQNGTSLGGWDGDLSLWTGTVRLADDGRRLIILPAQGVDVGSLYFRHGGVVVARSRAP